MNLPQAFTEYTSSLFGAERWQRFVDSFTQEPVVSVRYNPWKQRKEDIPPEATPVPWCQQTD